MPENMQPSLFAGLKIELEEVLKSNILDYWTRHTIDEINGGFIGHINSDNTPQKTANKGVVLNTRILWTFSAAYLKYGEAQYLELAHRAYRYIVLHFKDNRHGGVFWECDYKGKPVNKRKQVYAQAFAIYALAEYYKAAKNVAALDWARELFYLLEKYSRDTERGGYIEAFSADWSELDDLRLSEEVPNEKKTMNTHLHVLEAYTGLLQVWPDNTLRKAQSELIRTFLGHFLSGKGHLKLFFTEDWEERGNVVSFGHDIEFAWLLCEAAEEVGDANLIAAAKQAAVKIAGVLLQDGLDTDGAVFNEKQGDRGKPDTDKHWWPQAEAMVGLMNAWQLSGIEEFAQALLKLWEFIKNKIIDHEQGEWFWKVDRAGNPFPEDEKVGFWKCPYHNSRACIEMIKRIDTLEAPVTKK